ncbi:MAG: GNAT family N-acetyltransferase [Bacteroidales bacterium]|nr:GNAT family N-acetyltransferase [Bacteroidales bacterium]
MKIIRTDSMPYIAGAFYVRTQAMAVKHHIALEEEFDAHDSVGTKYVVIVDDVLPVATCRIYPIDVETVIFGRIVVLPEYRHQGLGSMLVKEAESWARELGFKIAVIDSRDNKTEFYSRLGYIKKGEAVNAGTFVTVRMVKKL